MQSVEVGEQAPDASFLTADRQVVNLSDFWQQRTTVFLFLRHFG